MTPKIKTIIFSTLFSIILWVFISFSDNYTTSFKVPVKFDDIKEGNALLYQSASEVLVTIKGEGWGLAQIAFGPETVFKISTNENVGIQKANVRSSVSENAWINPSLQVAMVSPAEIDYTIERISYKKVPIIFNASLDIQSGYKLVSQISLKPDSVKISGPQSLITSISSVSTENIKFENVEENVQEQILLKQIKYVQFSEKQTNIKFDVQKLVDKTFKNVPLIIENVPNLRSLELFPSSINVTLRGGLKNLGIMSNDSITAIVDFNDAFLDSLGVIKPKITIPNFTTLTNVNPKTLKYIIKQY